VSPEQRTYPVLPIVTGDDTGGVVVARQKQAKELLSAPEGASRRRFTNRYDLGIRESILNEDSPQSLDQPEHRMWQFVI
jgi:hypothetical protein